VAVDPELRGCGIGERLIRTALQRTRGAMKLHVEHDNPARRLYERVGFASKYLEMRLDIP
jgi:ribosomal-protein-alanine N-acetyltransferase